MGGRLRAWLPKAAIRGGLWRELATGIDWRPGWRATMTACPARGIQARSNMMNPEDLPFGAQVRPAGGCFFDCDSSEDHRLRRVLAFGTPDQLMTGLPREIRLLRTTASAFRVRLPGPDPWVAFDVERGSRQPSLERDARR